MDQYDTDLLDSRSGGMLAPTIINTFLEQYDFSGKKIRAVCDLWRKRLWKDGLCIEKQCFRIGPDRGRPPVKRKSPGSRVKRLGEVAVKKL